MLAGRLVTRRDAAGAKVTHAVLRSIQEAECAARHESLCAGLYELATLVAASSRIFAGPRLRLLFTYKPVRIHEHALDTQDARTASSISGNEAAPSGCNAHGASGQEGTEMESRTSLNFLFFWSRKSLI